MISYPFESQNTGTAEAPAYDRAITAKMERQFNQLRYTTGVFQTPMNGLQVVALPTNGMTITVRVGGCHIEGALGFLDVDRDIVIADSSATLNRIDRIVARFDTSLAQRKISIFKKEGVPASNPVALDLTQQPNYYEIALADVYIKKGAVEITTANITDQRLNSNLCGLVVPAIPTPLDFTELYNQYQASLDEYLELVASALDETTAGLLQGEIDSLAGRVNTNENNINSLEVETEDLGSRTTTLETAMQNMGYYQLVSPKSMSIPNATSRNIAHLKTLPAGIYVFEGTISYTTGFTQAHTVAIRVNDIAYSEQRGFGDNGGSMSLSATIKINAGDEVKFQVYQGSGVTKITHETITHFSVVRIK